MSVSEGSGLPGSNDEKAARLAAEDAQMRRRLDELRGKLERADRSKEVERTSASGDGGQSSVGRALRVGTEFVAGVAVGGFIGYWIDKTFGTRPVGFVVFFMLGIGAGFLNVVRTARRIQAEMPDIAPQSISPIDDDDDEETEGPNRG